jgi:tRNA(fMet)-specific endonuclease VapC
VTVRYLLDTNAFIHLRQGRPVISARMSTVDAEEIGISIITHGELAFGAHRSPQRDRALLQFRESTSTFAILPLPVSAAELYGRIRAQLAQQGQMIGANDLWIAAHAIAGGYTLVTDNMREFERVEGLSVENWARDAS